MLTLLLVSAFSIEVHGHRGARTVFPENTLAAIEYALQENIDFIEIDTHVTNDGHIVIHHDPYINKDLCQYKDGSPVKEKIAVFELNIEEIKEFDCGSKPNSKFPDQTLIPSEIPTLPEVLHLMNAYRAEGTESKLNIELKYKDEDKLYPSVEDYVALLNRDLDAYAEGDTFMVQTFSKELIKEVEASRPDYYTSYLSVFSNSSSLKLLDFGVDALSVKYDFVSKSFVKKVHERGARILVWTANKEKDWKKLIEKEVDGIITDDPARLVDYITLQ